MKVPTEFEGVFRDIELTEREIGFLVWVAGWDSWTKAKALELALKAADRVLSRIADEVDY